MLKRVRWLPDRLCLPILHTLALFDMLNRFRRLPNRLWLPILHTLALLDMLPGVRTSAICEVQRDLELRLFTSAQYSRLVRPDTPAPAWCSSS